MCIFRGSNPLSFLLLFPLTALLPMHENFITPACQAPNNSMADSTLASRLKNSLSMKSSKPPPPPKTEHVVLKVSLRKQQRLTLNLTPDEEATRESPFYRLPTEIRRQILVDAFGGRMIHVDLSLAHNELDALAPASSSNKKGGRWRHKINNKQAPDDDKQAKVVAARKHRLAMCNGRNTARYMEPPIRHRKAGGLDFEVRSCSDCAAATGEGGSNTAPPLRWRWMGRICRHQKDSDIQLHVSRCSLACCSPFDNPKDSVNCVKHNIIVTENFCYECVGICGWLRSCRKACVYQLSFFWSIPCCNKQN